MQWFTWAGSLCLTHTKTLLQLIIARTNVSSIRNDESTTFYHLRFVKWPKYIRLQRQKVVLQTRLKVILRRLMQPMLECRGLSRLIF